MLFQLLTQHSGTKQALDPGWGGGVLSPAFTRRAPSTQTAARRRRSRWLKRSGNFPPHHPRPHDDEAG